MLGNRSDAWGLPMRVMHGIGMGLVLILIIHGWWMTEFAATGEPLRAICLACLIWLCLAASHGPAHYLAWTL